MFGEDGPPGNVALSTMNTLLAADPASNVNFLVALQKSIVERLIGVNFAFENVVLDAALLQIENVLLQSLDPLFHFRFLR